MDRRRFLVTITTTGTLGLAGCNAPTNDGDGANGLGGTPGNAAGEGGTNATGNETGAGPEAPTRVDMVTEGSDYYFDPVGLYVQPGTEITWVNRSGSHSSTAWVPENSGVDSRRIPEGATAWNSEIISEPGTEFSHTFQETGTYDYYCIPHLQLGMVGRLVVGEPGGLDDPTPPVGELPDPAAIVDEGAIGWEAFSG